MAITLVASVSAVPSGGTTAAMNTTGATLLVWSVAWWEGGGTLTLSDSKGNTWVPLAKHGPGQYSTHRFYYAATPIVGTGHTFTASPAAGASINQIVLAFTGAPLTVDAESGTAVFGPTSAASGSVTPTQNGCLILTGYSNIVGSANTGVTLTPAMTEIPVGANPDGRGATGWLVQPTAAAINPTWAWTGTTGVAVSTAVFRPGVVLVVVPDVVGDLTADAITAIEAVGLTLGTTTVVLTESVPAGHVVSQSPIAGTMVAPGSAVDLVVAVAPGVVITIDGVERRVRLGSMTIRATINGVDRFSAILDILDDAPIPALGEALRVTENGTPIFSGVVEAVQHQAVIATTDLSVEVSALDYSIFPSWRIVPSLTVAATYVRGILEALVDYLTPYGVTLYPDQQDGPSMPTMTWEYRTVADILEELSRSTGMFWQINHEKHLVMWFPWDLHGPFDIIDGDGHVVGDIVVTPQDVEYANRLIVRAGPPTPVQVEDRYQGDGTRVTWPVSAPVVSHDNTVRIMTTWDGWWDETLGPDATFDWVFDAVANTVTRVRTSATPPPSSSTNPAMDADWQGWFTFMADQQVIAIADDVAGQAARGLREKFVQESGVTTIGQAQALADGLLARHSRPLRQVEYTTRIAAPIGPGLWQTLQVARRDLDGQFVVTEMTIQMSTVYPMLLRTVTLQEGVVVGPARTDIDVPFQGSWRDLYRQWRQVTR
jgi:hypothetical protein